MNRNQTLNQYILLSAQATDFIDKQKRVQLTLTTFDLRFVCIFRDTKDRIEILQGKKVTFEYMCGDT